MHTVIFLRPEKMTVITVWLLVWNKAEDVTELTHTYVFSILKNIHRLDLAVASDEEATTSTGKLFQWLINHFHVKIMFICLSSARSADCQTAEPLTCSRLW